MKPKTASELVAMREGGRILASVLQTLAKSVRPGITTAELDQQARSELEKLGARPAFLGFDGFPAAICISVNAEVVHGIPSERVLANQDVVKLDLGVTYKGLITDGAITVVVGQATADVQRLIRGTKESLAAGISAVRAGNRVGDISAAIEAKLREHKLGIIEELCGHGVGHAVHEEPNIPNYGRAGRGELLEAGMTLAIEPMATLGGKAVQLSGDGWTYLTADNSLAAQFEHTVLVTETGAEILTRD